MKTSKTISLILATGIAGVAFAKLSSASFTAAVPADVLTGIAVSAAVIGLAIYDYARRPQPLTMRARLLRPTLPVATVPATGRPVSKSHCDERAAA